jgi:hypothetical protein
MQVVQATKAKAVAREAARRTQAAPHIQAPACVRTLAALAGVMVVPKLDGQLNDHPHADGDEAAGTDAGHDLLQVGNLQAARTPGQSGSRMGVCG